MNKEQKKELYQRFEKNGLKWVREQLYTNGGDINVIEAPYAKIWVEDQKEKQRKKEKIEGRIWNLVFLLIGASISAIVVLHTTKAQLGNLNQQHAETMREQKEAIEQIFKNGIDLMLLQYKTESELRFLTQIYNCIEEDFVPVFPEIHKMRNNWKEQLYDMGKEKYLQKLNDVVLKISNAIRKFDKLLKKNSHHKEIYEEFYRSLSFQSKYSNPITDLRVDIERFPDNFTVENLKVLDPKGEKFSEAVNILYDWIENTKKLAQDKLQETYKLSKEEIKRK